MHGNIHWELLPEGGTITAEVYSEQLQRVHDQLTVTRPAVVNRKTVFFLEDNARPHVAKIVGGKLRSLGWERLVHPPYSPDIAPSDYHLFRDL